MTDITQQLKDFDLDDLDAFEIRQYNDFSKKLPKEEALQILINNVEGDYSQLSPKLAELAEIQYPSYEYKTGGEISDVADVVVISEENPLSNQYENWEDLYNTYGVSLIKSGDKRVIVFTKNYISQVDKFVVLDDINYIKSAFGIDEVRWVDEKDKAFALSDFQYENGGTAVNENLLMLLNDNKQIKHHSEELSNTIGDNKDVHVPAWAVAKVHRSASDLSDVTHYIDGKSEYKNGGNVSLNVGDKVKIIKGANKGIKGEIQSIEDDTIFKITIKTKEGHRLHGIDADSLELIKPLTGIREPKKLYGNGGSTDDIVDFITKGKYLTIGTISNKNLKIVMHDSAIEVINEMRAKDECDDCVMNDLFDDIRSNSDLMYFGDAGDVGLGLSSAPVITMGYYYDDDGELTDGGNNSDVYYFNNYAIDSFIDKMLEDGFVIFQRADNNSYEKGGLQEKSIEESEESVEIIIDNDWDNPKKFISFDLAKKWAIANRLRYDSLEIIDQFGDSIMLTSEDTDEDIEFLFSDKFDFGGNVQQEVSKEDLVRSGLINGEIPVNLLKDIIGCEPQYPIQIVGAIKLRKAFLRPYYKID